jgi:hypothetical protein
LTAEIAGEREEESTSKHVSPLPWEEFPALVGFTNLPGTTAFISGNLFGKRIVHPNF